MSQQESPPVRRGEQSGKPLRTAIVGGGKACENLLTLLSDERLRRLHMEILGVADPNPEAPGILRAKALGIFTTGDFRELYTLPGLNLLMELTGNPEVREEMIRTKPKGVSSMDHRGARLLWDLIQLEVEKQALEKESRERLHRFLEAAHDIICIKDLEGRYLYANPAAAASMKVRPSEFQGKTDFDLFPAHLAKAMAAHDRVVLEKGTLVVFREKLRTEAGLRYFHTIRFPIPDKGGTISSYAVISRDMTEEMTLQEEVRKHKEYLESVLQNTSDMVITTDLERRIVTFNRGGELMLGYRAEEVIGKRIEEFWKDPDARRRLMEEVQSKGTVSNFPAVLLAKDGRKVEISLTLSLLHDSQGKVLGTVGISKDVTEENRLRRQLIEQERLVAVGQTVAGITHCMKNVLNALKGGSYMVNLGLKRNRRDLLEEGWETVQKGIERIHKLSLDMLNYCKDRTPHPVPVDPMALARETVDLVAKGTEKEGIRIILEGEEGPQALLDPDAVGRALLNLVTNALEACREKDYAGNVPPRVEVRVRRPHGEVLFEVTDNGIGMDEQTLKSLFKRFFTTKEGRGTGLGLCVTEKIIREHGGSIQVASTPGQGSRFTLRLPERPPPSQAGKTS